MARTRNKRNGVGAECSVLKRFLHPAKKIKDEHVNVTASDRLDGLLAVERKELVINRRSHVAITFRHDDFDNQTVHCSERHVKVLKEPENTDYLFVQPSKEPHSENPRSSTNPNAEDDQVELPHFSGDIATDIAQLQAEGFAVDDDNAPAPENTPQPTSTNANEATFEG